MNWICLIVCLIGFGCILFILMDIKRGIRELLTLKQPSTPVFIKKNRITPEIRKQWEKARQERIKMVEKKLRSPEELIERYDNLYKEYLIAERKEWTKEVEKLKIRLEELKWIMGEG